MTQILRNIILVFLLVCAGMLQAQQLKVVEFRADLTIPDAVRFPKVDLNGDPCGLIKLGLAMPVSDVTFEGNIISSENKAGEWWIYMPKGSNWLNIKSNSNAFLPLRYEFEGIQSNVTYIMNVEKPIIGPEPEVVNEQYLIFQVEPKDAVLEVDDQLWTVSSEGTARKFVSFGTYSYRVQAPNYYPETGTVTVNDPKEKKIVPINLNPNFGWIEVKGSGAQGAAVYVDNAYIGKAPCKSEALKSGEHTVRIAKEMYVPYSEKVTVNDDKTTTLSPTLASDFAKVTLTVDADAEIWVNEEKKGTRTWTGNLASGTYRVECRLANHETKATTIEISSTMDGQTITLSAPKPISGSLNVESTPDYAKIFVDGKAMGETPSFIPQLLTGQHELKLTKDGYADYTETITITKGERKQVKASLNKKAETRVAGNPQQSGGLISGTYNGHDYVDLGLPSGTLWATCNVGANSPEEYGNYYAWGEKESKFIYLAGTYQHANGTIDKLTKYCNYSGFGNNGFTDTLTILQSRDDPATSWGSGWHTPNKAQWDEMLKYTSNKWITQNGVMGRLFTSKNGQTIFFPAAGMRWDDQLTSENYKGYYWSSMLYSGNPVRAWDLYFDSDDCLIVNGFSARIYGFSVRPVRQN